MDNIEIISVNYNTPDLIDRLIKSIREIEGGFPIRIIDGSDKEPFKSDIIKICEKYDNVILEQQGWNIHHGRGMDLGITTSKYEWSLIIDSDNYIQQPIIGKIYNGAIEKNKMILGWVEYVNNNGVGVGRYYSDKYKIKYYHPSLMLLKNSYYIELKSKGVKFIHHGAPCIKVMEYLYNNKLTDVIGLDIKEHLNIDYSDIGKYTNLDSRGTRNRFGIQLNK